MSDRADPHPESSSESEPRFDALLGNLARVAALVVGLGAVGLGIAYLATSITELAPYADSKYYMSGGYLRKGLHANRGFLYSQLVWAWTGSSGLSITALHALQLTCLLAALTAFTRRLATWAGCASFARRPVAFGLAALTLVSSPLLLHHAVSVMPDALATTWFLVVTMAVVEGVAAPVANTRLFDRRTILLCVAGLGAAFFRNEHAYTALAVCGTTGLLYAVIATARSARIATLKRCIVFSLCVVTSMAMNSAIQRAYPGEDEGSLPGMLVVNRIAYGSLPTIHPRLDENTRLLFPDAEELNDHPHNFPKQARELLKRSRRDEVEIAIDDIRQKAVEYDWHAFTTRYYRDWINHLVPVVSYPLSIPDGRPRKGESYWTFSRTEQHGGSRLVRSWIGLSQLFVWVLLASAALGARSSTWRLTPRLLAGTGLTVLLSASLYATVTPSFNPRYALPVAAIEQVALVTLAASALLRRRSARR